MTQHLPGSGIADTLLPDPEDRIFESSSSSEGHSDIETEDEEPDPISTQTRLLSSLQQNLDELRTNVGELTQRYPHTRNTSQISSLTNQINSFTQRLSRIRQNNQSHVQDSAAEHPMDGMPRLMGPPAPRGFDENADNELNASLSNEDLEQRIARLRQEELTARATPMDRRHPDGYRSYMVILNRVVAQRERAEQERQRREGTTSLFGTREEVERQGDDYQSPLTNLFARTATAQREFNTLMSRHRELSSDLERTRQPDSTRQNRASYEFTARNFDHFSFGAPYPANSQLYRAHMERPRSDIDMAIPALTHASDPISSSPPYQFTAPSPDQDRPESRLWQRRQNDRLLSPQTMQGYPPRHFNPPSGSSDLHSHYDELARSRSHRRRLYGDRGLTESGLDTPTTAGATESSSSGESPTMHMSVHDQRLRDLMIQQQTARAQQRMAHIRATMLLEQQDHQEQQHQPSLDNDATRPEPVAEEAKMGIVASVGGVPIRFSHGRNETVPDLLIPLRVVQCVVRMSGKLYDVLLAKSCIITMENHANQ
ncbi:MAG: hypothetical protein Q9222_005374 [Ikaeria aurantiellina]